MKIQKKTIVLLLVLMFVVGLSGCIDDNNNNLDDRFIGTWQGEPGSPTFIFYSDGACSYMYGAKVTWEIKNGNLVCEADGLTNAFSFSFFNGDNVLELHHISMFNITYILNRI